MENYPSASYKGFDIYPLIYRCDPPREWHERRPDRTYSASVMICREGREPSSEFSQVFPLQAEQWECVGDAKRAVLKTAEAIINGLVPGQSVVALA